MAIIKQVVLDVAGLRINRKTRIIEVRLRKQEVDGTRLVGFDYHRFTVEPGQALSNQIAMVNDHLVGQGWPAIETASVAQLQIIVATEHNVMVIAAYEAFKLAHRHP